MIPFNFIVKARQKKEGTYTDYYWIEGLRAVGMVKPIDRNDCYVIVIRDGVIEYYESAEVIVIKEVGE